jgi:hypothetical protein
MGNEDGTPICDIGRAAEIDETLGFHEETHGKESDY